MEITCNRCRQRLVVRGTSTKSAGVMCPSCRNYIPIPCEEEHHMVMCQQQQHQGFRSRIRNFGSHVKSKLYQHHQAALTASSLRQLHLSPTRPNKRALLCGITYNGWKYKLKGTVNDVKNMRELLIHHFAYPRDSIRVLTEEETDPRFIPTRKNIEDSLRWLVHDCWPGDSLVFFYSGHGLRQPDFNNDEDDGFDETICPVDFMTAGMIVDNDLNSLIVRPLTRGVTLHAIVDACHSGTILDLPNVYYSLENQWKDNSPPSGVNKRTSGGLAISISACLDYQIAADTSAFNGKMNGALTYLLAQVLKKYPGPTYGDLFDLIHEAFDDINQGCVANTRILRRMFNYRLSQTPLLSSSEAFDVYKKHLFL